MQLALSVVFMSVLITIGIVDFFYFIIPNKLLLPLLVGGIAFQIMYGSFTMAILGFAMGFLVSFIAWVMRGIGGGDVKLMATMGLWLGYESLTFIILLASMIGLIIAVVGFAKEGRLKQKAKHIFYQLSLMSVLGLSAIEVDNCDMKNPIPFGTCLAAATVISTLL